MYDIGWGKQRIAVTPRGHAMMGYGMWNNRAWGQESPLFARALCLRDASGQAVILCCLDLGYVSHAVRSAVVKELTHRLGTAFNEEGLVLTCTHTHSGPGGCSHEAMYNLVTPGFVTEHLQAIVASSTDAIMQSWSTAAPAELTLSEGAFVDNVEVAWNRALGAYNQNPDVVKRDPTQTHLALDRVMRVLSVRREGRLRAMLSLFGVHGTCVGNTQTKYSGDNKGHAARHAEAELADSAGDDAVAIFAQGTAGDVSPHYHGPGDRARRRQLRGEAEYAYAETNGRRQAEQALKLADQAPATALHGPLDAVLSYIDFTRVHASAPYAQGEQAAYTGEPCHGVAFFTGTRVDGPGMPRALGALTRLIARALKAYRMRRLATYPAQEQDYLKRLYAAQGAKDILMETGRKRLLGQPFAKLMLPGFLDPVVGELKREVNVGAIKRSDMVPTVLPLQIVRLGQIALVCCPGEFTTTAGQRVLKTVTEVLRPLGLIQVLICTYCNDYMGYVTTKEEYDTQGYEGGHTIFGQWTLAAFQTRFEALAGELLKPQSQRSHDRSTQPAPQPAEELCLRTDLPVPQGRGVTDRTSAL